MCNFRAGEMVRQLGAQTVLPEDQGLTPSSYMAAHNSNSIPRGYNSFLTSSGTAHTAYTYRQNSQTHKNNLFNVALYLMCLLFNPCLNY